MLRSTAVVATASAHRDAEALLALLASAPSVRVETTQPSITCLVFPFGVAAVLPGPDGLVLIASATDATSLGLVEDVLDRSVATLDRSVADLDWHFASADDRAVHLAAVLKLSYDLGRRASGLPATTRHPPGAKPAPPPRSSSRPGRQSTETKESAGDQVQDSRDHRGRAASGRHRGARCRTRGRSAQGVPAPRRAPRAAPGRPPAGSDGRRVDLPPGRSGRGAGRLRLPAGAATLTASCAVPRPARRGTGRRRGSHPPILAPADDFQADPAATTSPTLRSGLRASSGRMCRRIHGPPTSCATRSASAGEANSSTRTRRVSSTTHYLSARRTAVHDAGHDVAARLHDVVGEGVAEVQVVDHNRHGTGPSTKDNPRSGVGQYPTIMNDHAIPGCQSQPRRRNRTPRTTPTNAIRPNANAYP